MSLVDGILSARDSSSQAVDGFYDMDDKVRPDTDVPGLPPKSALRSSRLLDNHGLKLGGAVEAASLEQASTPHDVYLSSEEEASSDADDFSDYGYDSSVEDPESPTIRTSHEVTARVVSVVFAGKPSIVDLSLPKKRSVSSSSMGTVNTTSSVTEDRPVTPASSITSSQTPNSAHRRSSLISDILSKKKPPFLSIDPYANGTTYSLPKALDSLEGESPSVKTPRTPTQMLKGVTRSLSLVRKRSRPAMAINNIAAAPTVDTSLATAQSRPSTSAGTVKRSSLQLLTSVTEQDQGRQQEQQHEGAAEHEVERQHQIPQPEKTPQTPITYQDILRAVKKNAIMMGNSGSMPLPQSADHILSPNSPGTDKARRGILSGLSARRRSVKLTGRS
ncbi:hypothetical protein QBC42DRAFT_342497 [Cladorrhinum samala]|uniref:Uncharacterized protein n=1 Tax=Cladorrhinum samala TaxID=585594 RepID=A0AAV9I1Q9_9PEZI|nr:hypothetical protein QBC42DRAFT_342497 [Cladorrhinum samala]